jgi:hypothetical protein
MVRLEQNQILLLLDQNGVELFCPFSLSVLGQVFLDRFDKYYQACEPLLTIDNIVDAKPIRSANGHVLAPVSEDQGGHEVLITPKVSKVP